MSPRPGFCADCIELQRSYLEAVAEHRQLDTQEVEATIAGRDFGLEGELRLARKRRKETKAALITHVKRHERTSFTP